MYRYTDITDIKRGSAVLKKNIIRFILVGGTSTSIDFVIYMTLCNFVDITIAKCCSMLVSSIFSFFINKNWTFERKDKTYSGYLVRFYICFAINMLVNIGVNRMTYNLTKNKIIAFILATGVGMVVNFMIQKFWVFKYGNRKVEQEDGV